MKNLFKNISNLFVVISIIIQRIDSKKLFALLGKWLLILVGITAFVLFTVVVGKWIGDQAWIIFLLDIVFCLLLYLFLKQGRSHIYAFLSPKHLRIIVALGSIAILDLIILLAATVSLFDVLFVRLNLILFAFIVLGTIHFSLKKQTRSYS
ncbi:hypothetical protein K9M48_00035 [Candidatus Gracilibacteria bacterium]|nr:hypothetical protein [Candidatus Gracilibacteria bacterium]